MGERLQIHPSIVHGHIIGEHRDSSAQVILKNLHTIHPVSTRIKLCVLRLTPSYHYTLTPDKWKGMYGLEEEVFLSVLGWEGVYGVLMTMPLRDTVAQGLQESAQILGQTNRELSLLATELQDKE
ncbi:hypothetical protein J4Q44_G00090390 [Coregonus suidteri]|uniref:Uncharacterized protein n=1 Tax=Coregonus suidteri TaxID=861788 RepID=A0AAN8M672_9TELE